MHPMKLKSLQDLVDLLGETEDWAKEYGGEIFKVIAQFNSEQGLRQQDMAQQSKSHSTCQSTSSNPQSAKRLKGNGVVFMSIETPESFATTM